MDLLGKRQTTYPAKQFGSIYNFFLEYEEIGGDSDEEVISDIVWSIFKNLGPMLQTRMEPIPIQLKADIIKTDYIDTKKQLQEKWNKSWASKQYHILSLLK